MNNVELAYTPTRISWLGRIEAQPTALRYFALEGASHTPAHRGGGMMRRCIIWRNKYATDARL